MLPMALWAFARLRPSTAVVTAILGGILFLPEGVYFDAPLLPPLGKNEITALSLLIGTLLVNRGALRVAKIGRQIDLFWLALIPGTILTVFTNPDPVATDLLLLPGLTVHDIFAGGIRICLVWVIPFIVARVSFRKSADAEILLVGLVVGALVYLPFVLVELRLSPQMHRWVYGFAQHSFLQTIRAGGYRPMCFLEHGLALALFYFIAITAGWICLRAFPNKYPPWLKVTTIGLTFFFPLLRSLGALIFAACAIPLVLFAKPRTQMRFGFALAIILCAYPLLRVNGWIPVQDLINSAGDYSQDRAGSLEYRLAAEDLYLKRASERPWFGWGGYGRSRVDAKGDTIKAASDGAWVICLGANGYLGYYARFGMMLASIFLALRRARFMDEPRQRILGGLSLIVGFGALDLIPNALWNIWTVFYCGALAGLSEGMGNRASSSSAALVVRIRKLLLWRLVQAHIRSIPGLPPK